MTFSSYLKLGGQRRSSDLTVALIWGITLLLMGIGLIMVLSASSITSYTQDKGFLGVFWRQALFALLGLPLMIFAATRKLEFWKRWAWLFLIAALMFEALVFTPLGYGVGGNRNWLHLGPLGSAQPSEALKLALVVWIAAILLRKENYLGHLLHEMIPVIIPGAVAALGMVLLGHDLGTTVIMAAVVLGTMYFAGVSWKSVGLLVFIATVGAMLFVITSPNRMQRLFDHGSGNSDYSGLGWQPQHAVWALADGAVLGAGLGSSKEKWNWLPAADNDYIFAIIGEELGMIGALVVLLLFVALALVLLRVISRARDRFGRAVVGGIMVWLVGQALVNIAVVVRLLPVLGVPLPLISVGGTALLSSLLALGVAISVARDSVEYQNELQLSRTVTR